MMTNLKDLAIVEERIGGDADAEDESASDDEIANNAAWAEAMGKILKKQGTKDQQKSVILVKNKEKMEENKQERTEQRERKKQLNKKRKWEEMNHIKPNPLEKDFERSLQKIATRGVVQLFNAVKKHQKQLEEKLKTAKTEGKKEKVMKSVSKGDFLDMLKDDKAGGKKQTDKLSDEDILEESKDAGWDVLRDDFMMGNKLKDWDQRSDGEEE